ncbi:MAG: DUF4190 domain-containing protein [Thermoflexales bacterium]|nr:DUF4190 domain-containing protein [Thermoflexales bacterium]
MSQDYPSTTPTNSTAVISLIASGLGLIGILPFIGSLAGIITGRMARQEIARSGGAQSGEGLAQVGEVLGWVGLALWAVGLCLAFLVVGGSLGIGLCAILAGTQAGWESLAPSLL